MSSVIHHVCHTTRPRTVANQRGWLILAAMNILMFLPIAHAAETPRERLSFNADWRFQKDDPMEATGRLAYAEIKNWVIATGNDLLGPNAVKPTRPEGNLGDDVAYTQAGFDDGAWRKLNLPHDWGIEGPFKQEYDGATGRLPYWGVGWYRKHFKLPASDQGKQVYLDIDGAMSYANVWLNGQYVGGWPYGYSSFRLDLTPWLKYGEENVVAIRLDNPPQSSRWYPGGGIYRNVWLVKTAPIHVGHWGTYITTPQVNYAAATIDVKATVANDSRSDANLTVHTEIFSLNAAGEKMARVLAATAPVRLQIAAGQSATAAGQATVESPQLWGIKSPHRYLAVTTVEQNGRTIDSYETPFGIRTIKFDPEKGFFLNGQHLKFNGVCDHHDLGALGSAVNLRALERQLELLQEMGCNAIRTSHNPPAPELLDLCDRMGFVVMDETFDTWRRAKRTNDYSRVFADWHEKDTRMLVRRDRNHPSVALWSIGNEIAEQGASNGTAVAKELSGIVHEEDPTRPTTAACNTARPDNPFHTALDVMGFNYQGARLPDLAYPAFHTNFPNQFEFGSETASTISSRGEYVFPVASQPGAVSGLPGGGRGRGAAPAGGPPPPTPPGQDVAAHQMSSYDLYYPRWATSPDTEFAAQDRYPFVGGEFVWTGWDYLGEPTPWGGRNDPSRSSYFGIIDLAGFKKDRFYIYQAHWRPDLPMAHILPHWNWPDRMGQVTPVHVYTSGDEAELFLNGKSLGRKQKEQYQYRLRWDDVKYAPGTLKVVAYKNGRKWATDEVQTTGPAAKLVLTPDRATVRGDGQDLSFVTVTVADKDGRMVPRSKNMIRFAINGPGEIVATDNGDATDLTSFQSNERNAFNGLCLAIVRTKPGQSGIITLTAQSEGLAGAKITIRSGR